MSAAVPHNHPSVLSAVIAILARSGATDMPFTVTRVDDMQQESRERDYILLHAAGSIPGGKGLDFSTSLRFIVKNKETMGEAVSTVYVVRRADGESMGALLVITDKNDAVLRVFA